MKKQKADKEVGNLEELINMAKELNEKQKGWHWHYFPGWKKTTDDKCHYGRFAFFETYVLETQNKLFFCREPKQVDALKKLNELWYASIQ